MHPTEFPDFRTFFNTNCVHILRSKLRIPPRNPFFEGKLILRPLQEVVHVTRQYSHREPWRVTVEVTVARLGGTDARLSGKNWAFALFACGTGMRTIIDSDDVRCQHGRNILYYRADAAFPFMSPSNLSVTQKYGIWRTPIGIPTFHYSLRPARNLNNYYMSEVTSHKRQAEPRRVFIGFLFSVPQKSFDIFHFLRRGIRPDCYGSNETVHKTILLSPNFPFQSAHKYPNFGDKKFPHHSPLLWEVRTTTWTRS